MLLKVVLMYSYRDIPELKMEALPKVLPSAGLHLFGVCSELLNRGLLDVQNIAKHQQNHSRRIHDSNYIRKRRGLYKWGFPSDPRWNSNRLPTLEETILGTGANFEFGGSHRSNFH